MVWNSVRIIFPLNNVYIRFAFDALQFPDLLDRSRSLYENIYREILLLYLNQEFVTLVIYRDFRQLKGKCILLTGFASTSGVTCHAITRVRIGTCAAILTTSRAHSWNHMILESIHVYVFMWVNIRWFKGSDCVFHAGRVYHVWWNI